MRLVPTSSPRSRTRLRSRPVPAALRRPRSLRAASRRSSRPAATPRRVTSTSRAGSRTSPTRATRMSVVPTTTHISGDADVTQILSDIGNIASSIPSASQSGFDPSQLGLASGAVNDASIDVYSGTRRPRPAQARREPHDRSVRARCAERPDRRDHDLVLGRDRRSQRGPDDQRSGQREAAQRPDRLQRPRPGRPRRPGRLHGQQLRWRRLAAAASIWTASRTPRPPTEINACAAQL